MNTEEDVTRIHHGPHGSALVIGPDGRALAGAGLNRHGDWTWWSRLDGGRVRQRARDRADAVASAERAALRVVEVTPRA